jgi:hypothetical protein
MGKRILLELCLALVLLVGINMLYIYTGGLSATQSTSIPGYGVPAIGIVPGWLSIWSAYPKYGGCLNPGRYEQHFGIPLPSLLIIDSCSGIEYWLNPISLLIGILIAFIIVHVLWWLFAVIHRKYGSTKAV